jgi:hypothetical protein
MDWRWSRGNCARPKSPERISGLDGNSILPVKLRLINPAGLFMLDRDGNRHTDPVLTKQQIAVQRIIMSTLVTLITDAEPGGGDT